MTVRTRSYLQTAERNAGFASSLLDGGAAIPGANEWGTVAAFYAAVHVVNALLFERIGFEPATHGEREAAIARFPVFRRLSASYLRLRDFGFRARYSPGFFVPRTDFRDLVEVDLVTVENEIRRLLDEER